MLALAAGWQAAQWWGTPWWPSRVATFIDQLGVTPLALSASGLLLPIEILRQQLLDGLDHVDVATVRACLTAGLGDLLGVAQPRVSRHRFRAVALLLEPDTPDAVCREMVAQLVEEETRS